MTTTEYHWKKMFEDKKKQKEENTQAENEKMKRIKELEDEGKIEVWVVRTVKEYCPITIYKTADVCDEDLYDEVAATDEWLLLDQNVTIEESPLYRDMNTFV